MKVEFLQEKIFELSKTEKLTQEKIAKAADVSAVTVNGWINGKRPPTINAIVGICNKFDIPLNYFFSGATSQNVIEENELLKKRNEELVLFNEELSKEMKDLKKELAVKAVELQKAESSLRVEFQNELHAQITKFYEEKTELKLSYELRLQELEFRLRLAKNGKLGALPHNVKDHPVVAADDPIGYNTQKEDKNKKEK